jgi:hypothetical protein
MEELIALILQFVIEVLFESFTYLPFEWATTRGERPLRDAITGPCVGWLVGGACLGGLSLLIVPHTVLHQPWMRIANLIAAPLVSATVAKWLAQYRQQSNPSVVPQHQFWYAFWFSLGTTAIRFVYASKL